MPLDIKLTIAIPTAGMVRMGFAYSLATLISKLAAHGIPTCPEATVDIRMDVQESSNWISNREMLVRRACDAGRTHLLFLDDDMVFEPQVVELLFSRRHPVVCTNYLIKTDNPQFVAVSLAGKRIPTRAEDTGIVPIAYSGFGVSLFDVDVFRKTPQPWFLPKFDPESSQYTTEDNPCFERIREAGFTCYMDQDASKLVSHVGSRGWRWDEWKPAADVLPMKKEA